MKNDVQQEAIFEMLSELKEKVDKLSKEEVVSTKTRDCLNKLMKDYTFHIAHYMDSGNSELKKQIYYLAVEVSKLATIIKNHPVPKEWTAEELLQLLPQPKEWTAEEILQLLPQPKKVTIWGIEFLRASFVITILSIVLGLSILLNIRLLF